MSTLLVREGAMAGPPEGVGFYPFQRFLKVRAAGAEHRVRRSRSLFSPTKAVKANARARVGTPPPERVLLDPKQKLAAKPKYKSTLADLLSSTET